MTQTFKQGDKVTWPSGQGTSSGTVQDYITSPKTVNGQSIDASEQHPRYLVENDNTGQVTGHKPETLNQTRDDSAQTVEESDSSDPFQPGDQVSWNTSQGKTEGKIVKKLTSPTQIKGHKVKASDENPEYLVETLKTEKQAAHKPDALTPEN